MSAASKKYKLFAAAGGEDPSKRPCAFFASPAGCRNGDNCKFSHSAVVPDSSEEAMNINASNSVVSSEESDSSDSEGEQQFVKVPPAPAPTPTPEPTVTETKKEKKKRKRNNTEDNQVFANPKTAKTETPAPKKKVTPPAPVPVKATAPPAEKPKAKKEKKQKTPKVSKTPDFRNLNLPIAAFSIPGVSDPKPAVTPKKEPATPKGAPAEPPKPKSKYAVPDHTETGRKWKAVVTETQAHPEFDSIFNFDKYKEQDIPGDAWVKTKPFGDWCKGFPQAIAIDCEMCETADPVSGQKNHNALCRVSIVNAENPDEVLLDSLVKPAWPVTDYRTWVNGIKKEDLEPVQFTLRHAQAFMMALCSEETVILGHAIQNDLAAMRVEHYCGGDSALLFKAKDSPTATVSLKDLAMSVMKKEMPSTHDSVNDARTAMLCLDHYREKGGKVEEVVRTPSNKYGATGSRTHHQLFVHRIPKVCKTTHLSKMFLEHTSISPVEVEEIDFSAGHAGKTYVNFKSPRHATLAFNSLAGDGEPDKSGRLQKKVYLRDGDYVRIRKMTFERDHVFPDGTSKGGSTKE